MTSYLESLRSPQRLFAPIKCHKGKKGCIEKTRMTHGMCPGCQSNKRARKQTRKQRKNGSFELPTWKDNDQIKGEPKMNNIGWLHKKRK